MNLDENQRKTVSAWIADGLKLSEIQKRLAEELDLRLTYMEVRLLMDDLQLQPKDPEPPQATEPTPTNSAAPASTPSPEKALPGASDGTHPAPLDSGDVTVTVDKVTRPGSVVSGQVTFSDGKKAGWYLDQMGRLGIIPSEAGYKPSQGDLMIFEGELQSALQKMGY